MCQCSPRTLISFWNIMIFWDYLRGCGGAGGVLYWGRVSPGKIGTGNHAFRLSLSHSLFTSSKWAALSWRLFGTLGLHMRICSFQRLPYACTVPTATSAQQWVIDPGNPWSSQTQISSDPAYPIMVVSIFFSIIPYNPYVT